MDIYKEKYLTYKLKYLKLKESIGGAPRRKKSKQDSKIKKIVKKVYSKEKKQLKKLKFDKLNTDIVLLDKENILYTKFNSDEEFNRIELEYCGSFLIKLIGENMGIIVTYFNQTYEDLNINVSEKLSGRSRVIQNSNNTLIPFGKDDVHWVYFDKDNKLHNPYDYNMQQRGGHQFCQTHSLILALYPELRKKTNPLDAFKKIIYFLNEFLLEILNSITVEELNRVNSFLYDLNLEEEKPEYKKYIDFLNNLYRTRFNELDTLCKYIINVLSTDYAEEIVPYWS